MIFNSKVTNVLRQLLVMLLVLESSKLLASVDYITVGDAKNYSYKRAIGTVFVSNPDVVDYKVINNHKVVIYSKSVGISRINIYDKDGGILSNNKVYVDLDLSQIRREIQVKYPMLSIKLTSVGDKVSVSGQVDNEKERNEIYDLVGVFLDRTIENYHNIRSVNKETINEGDATGGRSLIIDPWVKADNYYRWHGIIRNIKIREPMQVNVKISIAQVTKKFDETIGVDWSTLGNQNGSFSFVKFHPQDLVTVVNALGNDNLAHVLAEPNLTVISGGTAHFLSGGEVPVVTSNLNGSTVTFKPYGVSLDIGAKVLTSDIINLEVAPAVSEIEKTIEQSGFSMPQFLTSQTSTTIQLHDGDSFIISGMTNSLENEHESRIPLLGDIPLLGAIFSKDTTQDQKSELVIVATVNLVRPNKENDIVLPYIKTTSILTRLLNTDQVLVENEKRNDQSLKKLLDHGGYIK